MKKSRFLPAAFAVMMLALQDNNGQITSSAKAGEQAVAPIGSAVPIAFDRYHPPEELNASLRALNTGHPTASLIHSIAKSPGGRELLLLEIGPETGARSRKFPAVLVVANLDGVIPLASEAALYLASALLAKPEMTKDLTWFILPSANPDAAAHYFAKPLLADERNAWMRNDDMDEQTDEDGPEDLNGDGLVTQMRAKDPMGEWMPLAGEPRLMKRADPAKGEKGIYRLYSEGIDNDGDGEYNEDPPGGANIGITFPHLFRPFTATSGIYPGSESETYGIMRFVVTHPEIAMAITFGAANFCLNPPRGGRQGSADLSQIKIPERYASRFGADPNKNYTVQEIMDMLRPMLPPGVEITESMIASFLGLGAVINPLDEDLKFYRELSEKYKEFLKAAKLDGKRLDPAPDRDGSFELWAYYQVGVPSFAMDFWTLPEPEEPKAEKTGITADTLEAMTPEAFLALGEAKIGAFLKEVGAPPTIAPAMLIQGVQNGRMTPKQMAGMLRQMPKPRDTAGADPKLKALLAFSDAQLQGKGFVNWISFKHPTLGELEIGGMTPFTDTTPPASSIQRLLDGQVPWVFQLANRLPRVKFLKADVVTKAGGVYDVAVFLENKGYFPYPTAMGKRNLKQGPIVVTLKEEGLKFLAGRPRSTIGEIGGMGTAKLHYLLQADKPIILDLAVDTPNAHRDTLQIRLGGAQ